MPRVHTVNKARKDYPSFGIKKGDRYYWWEFRYAGKRMSTTYPKASQLTTSAHKGGCYSIQEQVERLTLEEIKNAYDVSEIVSDIESLRDEAQNSLDNMPEQLQQAPTGELLQSRIDAMDQWVSEFEGVDLEIDEDTFSNEAEEKAEEELGDAISWEEQNPDSKERYGDVRQARVDEIYEEKLDERAQEILDALIDASQSVDVE